MDAGGGSIDKEAETSKRAAEEANEEESKAEEEYGVGDRVT